jgi:hypothetical protein
MSKRFHDTRIQRRCNREGQNEYCFFFVAEKFTGSEIKGLDSQKKINKGLAAGENEQQWSRADKSLSWLARHPI